MEEGCGSLGQVTLHLSIMHTPYSTNKLLSFVWTPINQCLQLLISCNSKHPHKPYLHLVVLKHSSITVWKCLLSFYCVPIVCVHNLCCQAGLCSNWRRVSGCWRSCFQWWSGLSTLFEYHTLLLQSHGTTSTCFTASIFSMYAIYPLALRFYKALCHLMHYSTDLCPLSLAMSRLLFAGELAGMFMQWKWMCRSRNLPPVSVYMMFYFVINLRVYFLCPFVLFLFESKDVYYTVLFWPVS